MTPCIRLLKKEKVSFETHQYEHDSNVQSYGEEAAQKLGIIKQRVFKTLVLQAEKDMYVAIIPVSSKLSLKKMAKAVGVKKLKMAEQKDVENTTGYILGGVSPIGQKKLLKSVIDTSAQDHESIYVSAGKRGLEVELSAVELKQIIKASFEDVAD